MQKLIWEPETVFRLCVGPATSIGINRPSSLVQYPVIIIHAWEAQTSVISAFLWISLEECTKSQPLPPSSYLWVKPASDWSWVTQLSTQHCLPVDKWLNYHVNAKYIWEYLHRRHISINGPLAFVAQDHFKDQKWWTGYKMYYLWHPYCRWSNCYIL